MTTTIMNDSIVGDQWIATNAQAIPIQPVMNPETGQPSGDFLSGPVRLAFPHVFELPKPTPDNENPKYEVNLLFTPYADFTLLYNEYYRLAAANFPEKYNAQTQQYYGIGSPFRDQAEKPGYAGYTAGCQFFRCSSQFKPPVVDVHNNPIVEPSKVYPGVWAIVSFNFYVVKIKANPGISCGLQSIMIIGDDQVLAGGAPDTGKTFADVRSRVTAPAVSSVAAAALGATPPTPATAVPAAPPMPGGAPMAPPAPAAPPMPGAPAAAETEEQRIRREMGL